jgi:hypothetical protein
VYKLNRKRHEDEGVSFLQWTLQNDLSGWHLKSEEMPDKLFEFQGRKIIYDNKEVKLYTFIDISLTQKCDIAQREGTCQSSILINHTINKLSSSVENLNTLLESLEPFVSEEGKKTLKDAKNTTNYIDHILNETNVSQIIKY